MTEMSENELAEFMAEAVRSRRPHAGYFSFRADRSIEELGVLNAFAKALKEDSQNFFKEPRHSDQGNDPPDCEALTLTGERIGIEITELVDPDSAAAARLGKAYDWKDWRQALIPKLDEIIQEKDGANVRNGPYSEYVLLIHTDEPWLELNRIGQSLAEHVFPRTNLITKAYLLISYHPSQNGCTYFRLIIDNIKT